MTAPLTTPEAVARREARDRTKAFLQDKDQVDLIIERIASGEGLRTICREHEIVYSTTQVFLAEHHTETYDAAKRVRADTAIDDLETLEGKLENNKIGFNEFRELANSKKWRAEKLNPKRYGDHQTIDMNVTDKTALHLDAIRRMSRIEVRRDTAPALPAPAQTPALPAEVVNAEFVEVKS